MSYTSSEPYYERFFRDGLTDAHRTHGQRWHG
jgi:hypothetical protein